MTAAAALVDEDLGRILREHDPAYARILLDCLPPEPGPRVLFTGSRYWGRNGRNRDELNMLWLILLGLRRARPDTMVIHGDCWLGADAYVDAIWSGAWGLNTEAWPGLWDDCGPQCGDEPHRLPRKRNDRLHPGAAEVSMRWSAGHTVYGPDGLPAQLPEYEAAPDTYCTNAGPARNLTMIATRPHLVVALYDRYSRGTRGTATAAERARIRTLRNPDPRTIDWAALLPAAA